MPSRTLTVIAAGDARGANRMFDQLNRSASKTEGNMRSLGKSGGFVHRGLRDVGKGAAYALGAGGFGGGLYALFDITKKSIGEFRESQRVTRQTAAVLKSTGQAAGITAKGITDLATATSRKTGIDDEAIQAGENMLLTFTKVRNETGRGNDIFNQATTAVTDMATAMSGGATPSAEKLRATSIAVGKALNDPIRGSTALRRVGVALTKQQQDQIKTLESHGHHLQAQKIILGELTKEFGGSAAKQKTAGKSLNVTLGNLAETIGGYLAPRIEKLTKRLNRFVNQMQDGRGEGGRFVKKLQEIGDALSFTAHVFGVVGGAIASVTRWLARASANVSLFVEDVLHGTRQTGRFGAALHDVGVTLGNIGRILFRIARGSLKAMTTGFHALEDAVKAVISPVKWLLDHIPKIHLPHIKLPFGDPRAGWEKALARANAGGGVPGGTLSTAAALGQRFGLHITSGYRDPARNRAAGGVEGSLHTHGTPANPGAVDLVGPASAMYAAEEWAREHLHLKELLVHDVGSGLHLHLGFGDPQGVERAMARRNAVASGAGALSFRELEALWVQAGGRREAAAIMAHIALAESGGIPSRNNGDRPGDGGRTIAAGLWQILGLPFPGNVYDPLTNARMAIAKSGNGRNLHPWDSSRGAWAQYVGTGGTYTGPASGAPASGGTGGGGPSPATRAKQRASATLKALKQAQSQAKAQRKRDQAAAKKWAQRLAEAKKARTVNRTLENPWIQAALTHYDNLAAAGQMSEADANAAKSDLLQKALDAPKGLTGEDRLVAQGMIHGFAPGDPDAVDSVADEGARLGHIDALLRAGDITDDQARSMKIGSLNDALSNWTLTDDARLELWGELNDLLKENTQAQEDANRILEEHTAALNELKDEIKRQTDFATTVTERESGAMARWVTEVISKQMGFGIAGRGLTPSYGVARRS